MKKNLPYAIYLIVTAFILMILYADIYPKWMEEKKLARDQSHLQKKLVQESQVLAGDKKISQELTNNKIILSRYLRINQPSAMTAEIVATIMLAGQESGLPLTAIRHNEWAKKNNLNALSLQIEAVGDFLSWVRFIFLLSNSANVICIKGFDIRILKENSLQIVMEVLGQYVVVSSANFISHSERSEGSFQFSRNPFLFEKDFLSASGLMERISYKKLKFNGYLYDRNQFWALVKLPNKKTIEIKQGTLVGLEKFKVIALNEQEVVLEQGGVKQHINYENTVHL